MNPDVPCRVSADELAHDREQERLPYWTCQRCQAELYDEDASKQNWLVCKGCGEALCEECAADMGDIAERAASEGTAAYVHRPGDERFTRLESVHNLGFCRPGCLAAAHERDDWNWRRGQLRADADEAEKHYSRLLSEGYDANTLAAMTDAWASATVHLRLLVDQVRAVCNLERK